ncbi:MAG: amidohydrolase family protein [Phycisphaerae bacterium]|nr:amidohydrolase family protein [Phycisphaerae bacterium]
MSATALKARWVIPATLPPIENGMVVFDGHRIIEVGHARGSGPTVVDLGDVAIVPGFVNAHTHLELTFCHHRVPFRGTFVDWVEDVVALHSADLPDETLRNAIREGFRRSLVAGVTTLGDIGYGPPSAEEWLRSRVNVVGFLEILGMGPRRFEAHRQGFGVQAALCEEVDELIRQDPRGQALRAIKRVGLSPHAPYSVDTLLFKYVAEYLALRRFPVCTHLAETLEEVRFLTDGTGPLRDLLERWNRWDGSFEPPGCSPVEYARRVGLLQHRPVLAHVNHVGTRDLETLAASTCHVAFCPRTHHFFGHAPHRYREMIDRGINVCIGTDSLASNDSLSVLEELRFLRAQDPQLSANQLLKMGTIAGAYALRLDADVGSIEVGKQADLVVIPLRHRDAADPVEDILSHDRSPSAVYLRGSRVAG